MISSGHPASNPRLVKEADALIEAGAEVVVVAAQSLDWLKVHDADLMSRRQWKFVSVDATPRLRRPRYVLEAISTKAAAALPEALWAVPGLAESAWSRVTAALTVAASEVEAELFIAHNLAALPAAARIARLQRARLGFDAEDWHSEELADTPQNGRRRRLARLMEERYMPQCTYLTASSPRIADAYRSRFEREVTSILNVFPLADRTSIVPLQRNERSLYWFSQTIGPGRGLEEIVVALGKMKVQASLNLRGIVSSEYRSHLLDLARRAGVSARICFLPPAPSDEMVPLAARHDLGLALELSDTLNHENCISNKVFTYLLAGVPVVLSDTQGQRDIAQEIGDAAILISLSHPDQIASALDKWFNDEPGAAKSKQAAIQHAVDRFNWDLEKRKFLAIVSHALASRAGESDAGDRGLS